MRATCVWAGYGPCVPSGRRGWPAGPRLWLALAGSTLLAGGAVLIASHARSLGAAAASAQASNGGPVRTLASFQPALPGVSFNVPRDPAVNLSAQPGGALLVVANMRAERPVVIDLCSQALAGSGGRLAPLRIGYRFAEVARWAARNGTAANPVTLRNVVLSGSAMPQVDITGSLDAPLQLAWRARRRAGSATPLRAASRAASAAPCCWDAKAGWRGASMKHCASRAAPAPPAPQGELVLTRYRGAGATRGVGCLRRRLPRARRGARARVSRPATTAFRPPLPRRWKTATCSTACWRAVSFVSRRAA